MRGALRRDPSPERREAARTLLQLVRLGWGSGMPTLRHLFSLQFLPDAGVEQLCWFDDLQRVSTSPENAARTLETFDQVDVADIPSHIKVPTLVLHSRGDARVPFEEGRGLASAISGARFVPLESNNHLPLHEEPAFEEMIGAITGFLGEGGTGSYLREFADWTPRERDIRHLVAQGLTNTAIARRLSINVKTVRNRMTTIFDKLQVGSRGEAIVRGREAGFGQSAAAEQEPNKGILTLRRLCATVVSIPERHLLSQLVRSVGDEHGT